MSEVLVLNSDFEPLNVCHMRRALVMVYLGKADILHSHEVMISTLDGGMSNPSVVKLKHHVRRPLPELKLSRRTVFARDDFRCQYCGILAKDLTIDHVIPKRHGGKTTWDNCVASCRKCNMKKSDKFLHQTAMKLMTVPKRPKYIPYISLTKYLSGRKNDVWRDYLPVFADFKDFPN